MIVAKVNGREITEEQLACESIITGFKCKEMTADEIREQALKNLVDSELVMQAAIGQGIGIADYEVDEAMVDLLSSFSSEDSYHNKLTELNLTEDELRERLSMHVLVSKYLQGKFDCDDDCEEKLKNFYVSNRDLFKTEDRVKLSHILIRKECDDSKKYAEEVHRKIKSEEDFEKMAKSNSCCPSCMKNGELGYISRGQFMPELDNEIFALDKGEMSNIIETEFGYHIFYIKDYEHARNLKFEEIKHVLANYRRRLYFDLYVTKHFKELRAKAEIELL